jgi:hypothetical protein
VVESCKGSTDTFVLTPSNVTSRTYVISNPGGSYTAAPFTEGGLYCTADDIVYTMSVKPTITTG